MTGDADPRESLLVGQGLWPVDDFARFTGLDRPTVEALVEDGRLTGGRLDPDGRVAYLLDDLPPTAEQLRGWGLIVKGDYDRDELYGDGSEDEADEPDDTEPGGASPDWTMSWEEPGC